jgi:hypothetical protein
MVTKLRAANPNVKLWSPAVAGDKQWLKVRFDGRLFVTQRELML